MGSFITNKGENKLFPILAEQLSNSSEFDCLVAYFYRSGFYKIKDYLKNVKEIKILVGISIDQNLYKEIKSLKELSDKEIEEHSKKYLLEDLEGAEYSLEVEEGVNQLKEWIELGKLKIKACKDKRTHAKVYIMTYDGEHKKQLQPGTVITGSSNLTSAGLEDNLEFNVFLQDNQDYKEIKLMFDDLWENHSVDISNLHVQTLEKESYFRKDITPYEFYLKFLQEYFIDELEFDEKNLSAPNGLMNLDYQKDAVARAKKMLKKYCGVFISDVVGLGKTFIATMLARELTGKTLVIAPPMLINRDNPGSWPNVFDQFQIHHKGHFESIGRLDSLLKKNLEKYENVIIDEAHRFRNSNNKMYNDLSIICRGKNIILVTATPLNNRPDDLKNQLALFTPMKDSKFHPLVKDLDQYFTDIRSKRNKLKKELDEKKISRKEYLDVIKKISEDIRSLILSKVMIRRTRKDIKDLFPNDMNTQSLKFPEVKKPKTLYYTFDDKLDNLFESTLKNLLGEDGEKKMSYSRYTPVLYFGNVKDENKKTPQKNIKRFVKTLVAKRLESSFEAFRKTINRIIKSYENTLKLYKEKGYVVASEDYYKDVLEYIDEDDWDAIEELVAEGKGKKYEKKDENHPGEFEKLLNTDLFILKEILALWEEVDYDPKLDAFKEFIKRIVKSEKIVVFSESKDTINYLEKNLQSEKVICYSGSSGTESRDKVLKNFDHYVDKKEQKDNFNILITTDSLSEGVNLNRANIVLNYDIPWNPVRIIQRVGRINRVAKDLPFDEIFIYNFFPAKKINDHIKLQENAEEKINSFIKLLGNDSQLLFEDEEICSHKEFLQHIQSSIEEGESQVSIEDAERKKIREIREKDRELFKKIENLPKKIKIGRKNEQKGLFTFFKKGDFRFTYSLNDKEFGEILDFGEIIKIIQAEPNENPADFDIADFYEKFKKLNDKFLDDCKPKKKHASGLKGHLGKIIDKIGKIKNDERIYEKELNDLSKIEEILRDKKVPNLRNLVKIMKMDNVEACKFLIKNIPAGLLKKHKVEEREEENKNKPEEIILSEYFV